MPRRATDFVAGLVTLATNGDARMQAGIGVHLYAANRSMEGVFASHDGELLLVPQEGALELATEFGRLALGPGEIAVIPKGVKFRVAVEGPVRGYACENYGAALRLPDALHPAQALHQLLVRAESRHGAEHAVEHGHPFQPGNHASPGNARRICSAEVGFHSVDND